MEKKTIIGILGILLIFINFFGYGYMLGLFALIKFPYYMAVITPALLMILGAYLFWYGFLK